LGCSGAVAIDEVAHLGLAGTAQEPDDEEDALGQVRTFLAYLPSSSEVSAPLYAYDDADAQADAEAARSVGEIVPASTRQAYDVVEVVSAVVDHGELVQVQEEFAPNVVVGFACFEGHPVGIVANQPLVDAGTLDVDASEKLARFVRFCDAFGLPVVTFVDVPGYRPGAEQEHAGIIRRGAKVINAYATATVPLVTIVLRKAYGGAYIVMGSKAIGADLNFCWPGAEIAVLGAAGAERLLTLSWSRTPVHRMAGHIFMDSDRACLMRDGAERTLFRYSETSLLGGHNRENVAMSLAVLRILGIDLPARVLMEGFAPLPHRCEHAGAIDGVRVNNVGDSTFLAHVGGKIAITSKYPIHNRRDLARVREERGEEAAAAEHERLVAQYADSVINPDKAVAIGEIDAVIAPEATRSVIVDSLAALADKRDARHVPTKKHDNIPL